LTFNIVLLFIYQTTVSEEIDHSKEGFCELKDIDSSDNLCKYLIKKENANKIKKLKT
jgi:hypothetical protein